jgi:hypothetical protein
VEITRLTKIMKIPSTNYQTPTRGAIACSAREPNSKIDSIELVAGQTKYPSAIASNGIIPGSPDFRSQPAAILAIVLVIEY